MIRYYMVLVLLTIHLISYGKSSSNQKKVPNENYPGVKNPISNSNYESNKGECRSEELKCSFTSQCLNISLWCNGKKDCVDGTDELNCSSSTNVNVDDLRNYFRPAFKTRVATANGLTAEVFNETKKSFIMDSLVNEVCKRDHESYKWHLLNHNTWAVKKVFNETKKSFIMDSLVNEICKRDYESYKWHLFNHTTWAVKMMESWEWPSSRFFEGRTHFGDYRECLSVSSGRFKGQYCLAEVILNYLHDPIAGENAVENPLKDVLIRTYHNNPISANKQKMKFALCIPSSCQPNDLAKSLNETLFPAFQKQKISVSVHVNPASCKTRDNIFSPGFYVVSLLFLIITSFVILSTYSDVTSNPSRNHGSNNNPSLTIIYESFSIVRNFEKLKHNDENDYSLLYFAKVLIILFIIYGHRLLYSTTSAQFDVETIQEMWKWPKTEVIYEGIISASFVISGFLMFHRYHSDTKRSGCVILLVNLLSRWMKLIPMVCIFVLYIAYILPCISDGPLWDNDGTNEVGKCMNCWWAIPLAVNNWIISSDRVYVLVSWYAAVNIQLTILGGILLLIYCKHKTIGTYMAILIFLTFTAITFAVAYNHNYPGVFKTYMMLPVYFTKHREATNFYAASFTKVGPYLFGFMCALVLKLVNETNEKAFNFSKKQLYILGTIGILLSVGTLHFSVICYLFEQTFSSLGNALYASIYQTLLVSGYAILFSIYFASSKEIVRTFFSGQIFIPLGRLTYSVYLSNIVVQLYYTYSQREVISTLPSMNLMWLLFGDIMCSYVVGLFVHLFIEAPLANISKFMRKKVLQRCGESGSIDHAYKITNASTEILTTCSVEDITYIS